MSDTEGQSKGRHPSEDKPWLFKPGQSGNPGGMKKGTISMVRALKKRLEENPDCIAEVISTVIAGAIDGNEKFVELLFSRLDGKLVDRIAGVEGAPVLMIQKYTQAEEDAARDEQKGDEDDEK